MKSLILLLALSTSAFGQCGIMVWNSQLPGGGGMDCTGPAGAGSGTVTSVGFTGGLLSVATATSTPAITVAGTSGGIPYFSSASAWASSGVLGANLPLFGGGAGASPIAGTRSGNTTQVVTTTGAQTNGDCVKIDANGNHIANGSACGSGGSGTVTSVGWTGGIVSVATATTTPALTIAGTSGGIPYFSGATTWASSGALTANLPVIGGGAGVAPTVGTRSGNTTAFVTTTGTQTSGDCVTIDASGNHIAAGSACGSAGGDNPVGGLGALQLYATSTTFTGDNTKLFSRLTAITPTQPVSVTPQGTPGAVTYTYAQRECNLIGCSVLSTVRTTTTGVDDLSSNPANFNRIVLAAVTTAGNTLSLWITATDSMTMSTGLVASGLTSGATYDDTTGGDGGDSPTIDNTTGLFTSTSLKVAGVSSFGSTILDPTILISGIFEPTGIAGYGFLLDVLPNPTIAGSSFTALQFSVDTVPNAVDLGVLAGVYGTVSYNGTGTTDTVVGFQGGITNSGAGTITTARGSYVQLRNLGLGDIGSQSGYWVDSPENGGGGTVGVNYGFYAADQVNADIPLSYFLWSDSPGVFRVKDDGVMAYYNPTFTKYTPGAANYERIVQQWNTNVAEIGTEAGGTGVLRPMKIIGSGITLPATTLSTTINKLTLTPPATAATLTLIDGTTLTGPAASGTAATLGNAETFSGIKTFGNYTAHTAIAAPGTPSAGLARCYIDSTTKLWSCKDDAGVVTAMGAGGGSVTSVGWTGGIVSVATATTTPALTIAGTSGGIPYFSGATTWASSGALTANLPVIGGGAGVAPSVGTRSGNTTAFVTTTGAQTSGDCVTIDASGNHIANGSACGSASVTAGTGISVAGSTVNNVAPRFLVLDDSAGGTDTYTGTSIVGFPAAYASMVIDFVPLAATTSASTLNVNAIGALAIKQADCTTDTATNDLLAGRAYPLRLKTGAPNVWCMFP